MHKKDHALYISALCDSGVYLRDHLQLCFFVLFLFFECSGKIEPSITTYFYPEVCVMLE